MESYTSYSVFALARRGAERKGTGPRFDERGGAPDRAASVRATFKIRERSMLQDPPQLDGGVLRVAQILPWTFAETSTVGRQ